MSNNRYIEFDSTYRNRKDWPNPGEFEILISQSGRKGKMDALDPISNAVPITSWTSNRVDANSSGTQVIGVVDSILAANNIAASNTSDTFIITSTAGNLQQETNYYKNLVLNNTSITEKSRIISYEYLGTDSGGTNDRARIVVSPSFGSTFSDGDNWVINDPTDLSNTSEALFFVPLGRDGDNAYFGCILYNETTNEYRNINNYDSATHMIKINTTNPIIGWTITDNYTIRKSPPLISSIITSSSTTSITLSPGVSTIDDFYNGQFLRIRPTLYGNGITPPETEIVKIVDYDGTTLTASVSPPFSTTTSPGSTAEILDFSHDNANPFVYTGTQVSQQEMVCYEIELINLVLPNKTLATSYGSRAAFYPYLYVELSNISGASAGLKNTIYSNNPNSTRMTFRVPIDDVPNPLISSFIKVDGDGMVQTLKFKPNDNLRFSVRLANGELYKTEENEFFSPFSPNPEIQISALFSIRRL